MTEEPTSSIVKLENIEGKLIIIQGESVLLDSDVADIYGVETKRINEAVKNNPDKFPEGYILDLSDESWESLRSKISALKGVTRGGHRKYKQKPLQKGGYICWPPSLKARWLFKPH